MKIILAPDSFKGSLSAVVASYAMKEGISAMVLELAGFYDHLQKTDLIITGEGKSDVQTISGKAPFGVALAGAKEEKPVLLISGSIEEKDFHRLQPFFFGLHSLTEGGVSVETAKRDAYFRLAQKTRQVVEGHITQKLTGKY